MRIRARIVSLFVAAFVGAGATVATASGPSISEFSTGLTPSIGLWGIAQGPDGNLWFTEETNNGIGRITPGGDHHRVHGGLPDRKPARNRHRSRRKPVGGAGRRRRRHRAGYQGRRGHGVPGADGRRPDRHRGRARTGTSGTSTLRRTWSGGSRKSGSITEFTNGLDPSAEPNAITKGPDGKLWFTEEGTGRIGKITTGGTITEFSSGALWVGRARGHRDRTRRQPLVHAERRPGRHRTHHAPGRRDGVQRRPDHELAPARHRRRARRRALVHRVRGPGTDRPHHHRWRHHRVLERAAADHEPVVHLCRARREHVVHREQPARPGGADHASAAGAQRRSRGRSGRFRPTCRASCVRTRRPPTTTSSTDRAPTTA